MSPRRGNNSPPPCDANCLNNRQLDAIREQRAREETQAAQTPASQPNAAQRAATRAADVLGHVPTGAAVAGRVGLINPSVAGPAGLAVGAVADIARIAGEPDHMERGRLGGYAICNGLGAAAGLAGVALGGIGGVLLGAGVTYVCQQGVDAGHANTLGQMPPPATGQAAQPQEMAQGR